MWRLAVFRVWSAWLGVLLGVEVDDRNGFECCVYEPQPKQRQDTTNLAAVVYVVAFYLIRRTKLRVGLFILVVSILEAF
jgi:hypothetical protein